MPFKKQVTDDEIAKIVPSVDELNGAGSGLNVKDENDKRKLTELVFKASQIVDDIEDACIILEIPKDWITIRNMTAWNKGKAVMRSQIMRSQLIAAHKGQPVSQIWLGKNKMGQSDRPAADKYMNKRYNVGSDLEDAREKLAKAFGKPVTKPKRKSKTPAG